jgi:TatD DNase family protein
MEGVIERAKEVEVDAIVAVSANLATCKRTLEWAETYPLIIYPALGIHPTEWYKDEIQYTLRFIEEHIKGCVAIGEIGLDYWNISAKKNKVIRENQRAIYVDQLNIARKYNMPVSVHGRGSWRDALDLARKHGPDNIVFHWYSGSLDILTEILDSDYMISATPACEFSKHHRAAIKVTPVENILMETDSPVSYQGKPGEPAQLLITLKHLSKLKDLSEEEVARITTRNAEKFFKILSS